MQKCGLAAWLLHCIYGTRIKQYMEIIICMSVLLVDLNNVNSAVALQRASFNMKVFVYDYSFILNNRFSSEVLWIMNSVRDSDFRQLDPTSSQLMR